MESHYQRATKSLANICQHHVHVLGTVSPQENLNPAQHYSDLFAVTVISNQPLSRKCLLKTTLKYLPTSHS